MLGVASDQITMCEIFLVCNLLCMTMCNWWLWVCVVTVWWCDDVTCAGGATGRSGDQCWRRGVPGTGRGCGFGSRDWGERPDSVRGSVWGWICLQQPQSQWHHGQSSFHSIPDIAVINKIYTTNKSIVFTLLIFYNLQKSTKSIKTVGLFNNDVHVYTVCCIFFLVGYM